MILAKWKSENSKCVRSAIIIESRALLSLSLFLCVSLFLFLFLCVANASDEKRASIRDEMRLVLAHVWPSKLRCRCVQVQHWNRAYWVFTRDSKYRGDILAVNLLANYRECELLSASHRTAPHHIALVVTRNDRRMLVQILGRALVNPAHPQGLLAEVAGGI